jgi:hypothetical protein
MGYLNPLSGPVTVDGGTIDTVVNPVDASVSGGSIDAVTESVPQFKRDLWYFSCVQGADTPALSTASTVGIGNTSFGKVCAKVASSPSTGNLASTPRLGRAPYDPTLSSLVVEWKALFASANSWPGVGNNFTENQWLWSYSVSQPSQFGVRCDAITAAQMGAGWGVYYQAGYAGASFTFHFVASDGVNKVDIDTMINPTVSVANNVWHKFQVISTPGTSQLLLNGNVIANSNAVGLPLTGGGSTWTWTNDGLQRTGYVGDATTEIQVSYA